MVNIDSLTETLDMLDDEVADVLTDEKLSRDERRAIVEWCFRRLQSFVHFQKDSMLN